MLVVNISATMKVGKNNDSLLIVVVIEQPSGYSLASRLGLRGLFSVPWRLRNDQGTSCKQCTHDALHEQRKAP